MDLYVSICGSLRVRSSGVASEREGERVSKLDPAAGVGGDVERGRPWRSTRNESRLERVLQGCFLSPSASTGITCMQVSGSDGDTRLLCVGWLTGMCVTVRILFRVT